MKITLTSIMVDDQEKALTFYTEILGFVKKQDFPVGEFRWITLTSPEGSPDIELALEPNENPAGKTFQSALYAQGIPATAFASTDIQAECDRLEKNGVAFRSKPDMSQSYIHAVFDDTCGNLIQIYQQP